ncbi:MAG: putative rane protein [Phycisphaerales bacterium]|nr:putative rane protein [Phycisphaerales bacterium]
MTIRRTCLHGCGRGFTLVEVLATLVLLGIILPVAMRGVSMSMAAASSARHTAEATALAEAKLNQLVADGTWASATLSGDFSPDQPEYQWACVTATRDYGLTEVAVRVAWTERGLPREMIVATLASQSTNAAGVLP